MAKYSDEKILNSIKKGQRKAGKSPEVKVFKDRSKRVKKDGRTIGFLK